MKNGNLANFYLTSTSMNEARTETSLLISRVQAGDRQAFHAFIKKYQRLVAAIVFRMVYNDADREELSQEIFLKIFAHIHKFQGAAKISSWIGRIASNTCINHLRKKRLPLFDDISGPGQTMENVADNSLTPESLNEQTNSNQNLQKEINRLPAHYRLILTLFHFSEMNYEEIGQALKMPAGTVKSHLFRARQKLRERLLPAAQERS
ncbi:MAG: sigma-70 family RNA polymerase sigma factor [Candidatus Aminicenantes bacterium]|nr:sigma-70 family RNA polymerase sigma factor [Candidatus Aminicenantes bacterium]